MRYRFDADGWCEATMPRGALAPRRRNWMLLENEHDERYLNMIRAERAAHDIFFVRSTRRMLRREKALMRMRTPRMG